MHTNANRTTSFGKCTTIKESRSPSIVVNMANMIKFKGKVFRHGSQHTISKITPIEPAHSPITDPQPNDINHRNAGS